MSALASSGRNRDKCLGPGSAKDLSRCSSLRGETCDYSITSLARIALILPTKWPAILIRSPCRRATPVPLGVLGPWLSRFED
jgi:hypothetical protein